MGHDQRIPLFTCACLLVAAIGVGCHARRSGSVATTAAGASAYCKDEKGLEYSVGALVTFGGKAQRCVAGGTWIPEADVLAVVRCKDDEGHEHRVGAVARVGGRRQLCTRGGVWTPENDQR